MKIRLTEMLALQLGLFTFLGIEVSLPITLVACLLNFSIVTHRGCQLAALVKRGRGLGVKLFCPFLAFMLVAGVSSTPYNYMSLQTIPINAEAAEVQFVTGNDSAVAGASIGTNGTYVVFSSIAGWPNATRIYEDAVGVQNPHTSPRTFEVKFDSWSGDTSGIDYIYVKIFNTTDHQQGLTIEVGVADSSTEEISIPASTTWRVQWEIKWQADALSTNTVSVVLIIYTTSTAWKLYHHRASPVSCETPEVILQQGTTGTSTIYANNTSAKVSIEAGENWWNSSWLYRKQINITEGSGYDLANYAINFTINTQELITNNKMNADCSDIRFSGPSYIYELPVTINNSENPNELINYQAKITITNQTLLSHFASDGRDIRLFSTQQSNPYSVENEVPLWIQSKTATELILWTKVNVSGSSTKALYMYYGNLSATTVSNGTEIFEFYDGFSANTISDYTIVDLGTVSSPSAWSVDTGNGWMKQTSNIYTHGAPAMAGTFAYHTSEDWGDNILEVKARSTDDDFFGLMFRYTNNSNYYRFAWERQDHTGSGSVGPGRYLHEIVGGTWNTIDSDSVAYTVGQWYDFKIVMNGNYIEAYIDDSLVLNGTGSAPASGKIAMYCWASQNAYWDDLRIRKLTSPEPTSSTGVENQIGSEDIELSYWIESGCNTTSTRIWVKIPSIPSNGNVTIYTYYGNSGASSGSDGKSTFYRYLNFSSGADGIDGGVNGQDGAGGLPTNYEVLDGGRTLHIWGNVWKYTILSTTVDGDGSQILEYSMNSTDNGELQGVGISNTISGADSSHTYKFTGSQSWGLTPDKTYSGAGGDWQTVYAILNDFSGTYSYFIWMGDDDADGSQDCKFKDVRVREYTSPEPSVSIGEENTICYDHVLKISNRVADVWNISLSVYNSSNIVRLSGTTISFYEGTQSDQIIVSNGEITQSEGPLYDLGVSPNNIVYVSMSNLYANASGTSYLYVYLEILVPDTSTYNLFVITFKIT